MATLPNIRRWIESHGYTVTETGDALQVHIPAWNTVAGDCSETLVETVRTLRDARIALGY